MKKMMTGWAAGLVVIASAGSLVAHHSLANYDTTNAVSVKGTVVLVQRINPHSIVFVDQVMPDGQTQRWAVEGPGSFLLQRMGVANDFLKVGDVIEACGYVTKVEVQRTVDTEPISLSLKATTPKNVSGRVMDGELLILPNGKKQVWSDYGHHLCLGTSFPDRHTGP